MADLDFLIKTLCLNPKPERVKNKLFLIQPDFFDANDIVQVKYEMLRSCEVDGNDVSATSIEFGFSRTTYYKVQQAFLKGGFPALMGKPRGRPEPIKVTKEVLGFLIAEKAKEPSVTAREMMDALMARYNVRLSERMIQHIWQHYSIVKKNSSK